PQLAARRPRQELADRDELREPRLVQPAAPLHELRAQIAKVRHRAAERGQAQLEEGTEDLAGAGAGRTFDVRIGRRHAARGPGWTGPVSHGRSRRISTATLSRCIA